MSQPYSRPSSPAENTRQKHALEASLSLKSFSKKQVETAWTVRRNHVAPRPSVASRKYDILWSAPNGDIMDKTITAPALPVFETAFSALARGALVPTLNGPIAIEDLLPGDQIETCEGDHLAIMWIGSMALDRDGSRSENASPEKLYRISADTFGFERPTLDLMLGAGARYLHRSDAIKSYLGTAHALAPVSAMVDGVSVTEVTPISTVRSYHICLTQHRLIRVNGIELETYHPGTTAGGQLQGSLRNQFIEMFPHLSNLGDFGAMAYPRLSPTDLMMLEAG